MGHVRTRALERYGLNLSVPDIRQIVQQILEGDAKRDPSGIPNVWIVTFVGRKIPVLFDEHTCSIRTVLPKDYHKNHLMCQTDSGKGTPDRAARVAFKNRKAVWTEKYFYEGA